MIDNPHRPVVICISDKILNIGSLLDTLGLSYNGFRDCSLHHQQGITGFIVSHIHTKSLMYGV